jgi:hypothetical protein
VNVYWKNCPGAGVLSSRWDFSALKSTILLKLLGCREQMDAFECLQSLVKVDGQEDCLPKIQWDPFDDYLQTLIILNVSELISGKNAQ